MLAARLATRRARDDPARIVRARDGASRLCADINGAERV
jgi:hypothetical protein